MKSEKSIDFEPELTAEDLAAITLAEKQIERGEVIDFEEVFTKIRNKYPEPQI